MRLAANERMTAARGRVVLTYQADGNLVLYHDGQPVWASMAFASPGVCQMQEDGNLVCYDASERPYWASHTDGHPGARLVVQDDGNVVIYAVDGTPIWATNTQCSQVDAPSPVGDGFVVPPHWQIYGNFLANGIEQWGFMAPSWWLHDRPRWERFMHGYVAEGYRHLPFALYGAYPSERPFDLRGQPDEVQRVVRDHLDRGITPIVMVLTDEPDGSMVSPNDGWRRVRPAVEAIADLPVLWATGWEIDQIPGWRAPENPRQGHDLIALCRRIRALTGRAPWVHFSPNWWGPHYEDGDEDWWWRDVGDDCAGLLGQIRPDAPLSLSGDPSDPDGLYLWLRYRRASDRAAGIVGRLRARGKPVVLFEHSREARRWAQVRAMADEDGRCAGVC